MRWPDLRQRSESLERMDDRSIGGEELAGALRQLRVINGILGAAWPTLEGVQRLWRAAGQPNRLTLIDVGAGSGDIDRHLLAWAARHKIAMQITLVDINPETCAAAATYYQGEPRVQVVCSDVMHLGLAPADIVTASLFTHHFTAMELPAVLQALAQIARLGVVVNDLHRHALAWIGIWVGTRLFFDNRMIRNDAPLSVQRGFRREDLELLRANSNLRGFSYKWRPLFRYLITLSGTASPINTNVTLES